MNLDKLLYSLPFLGKIIKRLYSYFKNHIVLTDFFHVILGFGIGLIIAREQFFVWGVAFLFSSILFHIYALIEGK